MHNTVSTIVSVIHAILACLFVTYTLFNLSENIHNPQIYIITNAMQFIEPIKFTAAYLTYDLFWSIYYRNIKLSFIIHHLITLCSSLIAIMTPYGRYTIFISILNEASTPFLNFNTLIPNKYFLIKKINMIIFAITFFFSRTILLSYMIFRIIQNYNFDNNIVTGLLGLYMMHYLLNAYWLILIIKKVMRN